MYQSSGVGMVSFILQARSIGWDHSYAGDIFIEYGIKRNMKRQYQVERGAPMTFNEVIYYNRLQKNRDVIAQGLLPQDYPIFDFEGIQQSMDLSRTIQEFITPVIRTKRDLQPWIKKIHSKYDIKNNDSFHFDQIVMYVKTGQVTLLKELECLELLISFKRSLEYTANLYPNYSWALDILDRIDHIIRLYRNPLYADRNSYDSTYKCYKNEIYANKALKRTNALHLERDLKDFLTMAAAPS